MSSLLSMVHPISFDIHQFNFDYFVSYAIEFTSQVLITILCNLLRCSMYLQLSWLVRKTH